MSKNALRNCLIAGVACAIVIALPDSPIIALMTFLISAGLIAEILIVRYAKRSGAFEASEKKSTHEVRS